MRIFHQPKFDFLGIKWYCITGSIVFTAIGLLSLVVKGGPNFGVDFTGGAQLIYGFSSQPDENQIRKVVESAQVKVDSVQRFDRAEKNQVLLRVPMEKKEGRDLSKEVTAALTKAFFPQASAGAFDLNLNGADALLAKLIVDDPEKLAAKPNADPKADYGRIAQSIIDARSRMGLFKTVDDAAKVQGIAPVTGAWLKEKAVAGPFTLLSAENVGPQVGKDLREKGALAVFASWAAMLAYIGLRFRSVSFGTAAVVALVHDTLFTLGLCSILNTEISLTVVAAFLTLIGYSVNDTVVVYDRIRENLQKSRREPLPSVVNRSINETLSRTILTSGLTFLVCIALFFLGGEVLRGFSFVMIVGIIVGTYSSVFIAAPLVIVWEEWKSKKAGQNAAPAAASSPKGKPAKAK